MPVKAVRVKTHKRKGSNKSVKNHVRKVKGAVAPVGTTTIPLALKNPAAKGGSLVPSGMPPASNLHRVKGTPEAAAHMAKIRSMRKNKK